MSWPTILLTSWTELAHGLVDSPYWKNHRSPEFRMQAASESADLRAVCTTVVQP